MMPDVSNTGPLGIPYQLVDASLKSRSPGALPKLVRVALYTRTSTPARMKGEFPTMDMQRFQLEATVAQNANLNWRITHVFSDEERSGTKRERKAIETARRSALAGGYDILLVGAQARIARDVSLSMQFIEDLESSGVEIWTITGQRISRKSLIEVLDKTSVSAVGRTLLELQREGHFVAKGTTHKRGSTVAPVSNGGRADD